MKFFIFFFVSFFFAAALAAEDKKPKRDVITVIEPDLENLGVKELLNDEDCDELVEPFVKEVVVEDQILPRVNIEKLDMEKIRWEEKLRKERFLDREIETYYLRHHPMMRNYMRRPLTMPMRDRFNMRLFNLETPMEMQYRMYRRDPLINKILMRDPKWETLYNFPRSFSWVPKSTRHIMNF